MLANDKTEFRSGEYKVECLDELYKYTTYVYM